MTESTLSSVIEVAYDAARLNTNEVSILGLGVDRDGASVIEVAYHAARFTNVVSKEGVWVR